MWWVRLFCLVVPVAIVAAGLWLWDAVDELSIEAPAELVVVLNEDPGPLNPLMPSSGSTREITDLLFERLFRRDDEMLMRGHLAERWELRQRVAYFFRDEAAAAAGLAKLEAAQGRERLKPRDGDDGKEDGDGGAKGDGTKDEAAEGEGKSKADERWPRWGVVSMEQDGDALRLVLSHHDAGVAEEIGTLFEAAKRFPVTQIRLTVRDSAEESFDLFRREAVEGGQIRHVVYDEANRTALISAAGEVDLFQRELSLFYEANENLEPVLETLGTVGFVVETEVLLHLREGITWHDGVAFSADDVVFSYREVTRPGSASTLKPWFASVIDVEALEPRVVRMALREPYAPLMESWEALPILPAHRLGGLAGAGKADWQKFFASPIGTGPYRLASRVPGKSLTLAAFDDYFRGAPMQDEIRYRVIRDRGERAIGLRLQQIDVLHPDEVERVALRDDRRFEEIDGVPRTQSFVAWNLRREPFVDGRVRAGLARLVDVRRLIERSAGPESRPCRGIFYPRLWLCPEETELPLYDVAEGLALLAEAGWHPADGEAGLDEDAKKSAVPLRNVEGERLSFRLLVGAENAMHRSIAAGLVEGWRAAGIDAEVETRPWVDLISGALEPRDFDAVMLSWELGFRRDQAVLWHSREAEAASGGGNFTGLRNRVVDGLLERLQVETEATEVQALAVELQDQLWKLQPCLFLYESGEIVMVRRDILTEKRPLMDGRRSDNPVTVPPAGLIVSRPWWVKQDGKGAVRGGTEGSTDEAKSPGAEGG